MNPNLDMSKKELSNLLATKHLDMNSSHLPTSTLCYSNTLPRLFVSYCPSWNSHQFLKHLGPVQICCPRCVFHTPVWSRCFIKTWREFRSESVYPLPRNTTNTSSHDHFQSLRASPLVQVHRNNTILSASGGGLWSNCWHRSFQPGIFATEEVLSICHDT